MKNLKAIAALAALFVGGAVTVRNTELEARVVKLEAQVAQMLKARQRFVFNIMETGNSALALAKLAVGTLKVREIQSGVEAMADALTKGLRGGTHRQAETSLQYLELQRLWLIYREAPGFTEREKTRTDNALELLKIEVTKDKPKKGAGKCP